MAKKLTKDQESMAICAIRYTIGRMSYAVSEGQEWALRYGEQSEWVRNVIIRDLQQLTDMIDGLPPERRNDMNNGLGMEMDERGWREVLRKLREMQSASYVANPPQPFATTP